MPRTCSITAGTFNLCKSAIGVGILSLPAAMSNAGYALGLLLLLFGSLTTSSTLHFLSRIAANTDMGDYFGVGQMAYGSVGEITAVAATLLYLFGALIAYASYTSDYFTEFLSYVLGVQKGAAWYVDRRIIIASSALLIFPLACLRDLSKLAKASIVGMMCMAFVCGLTVIDYFADSSTANTVTYTAFNFNSSALRAFSNILFAFCNHFTMLAIIPTFINPTPRRRSILLLSSSTVVVTFYFLVSLFGYLHFGDAVPDNILLARSTLSYAIAQLLVACVIIVSFPLLCDPTKKCVEFLLSKAIGKASRASMHVRNIAVTASLVTGSALLAMFAGHAVLPILGAFTSLCGSLLMFIFPALYFLRLGEKYKISKIERVIAYVDISVGAIILIFGTYFNVAQCIKDLFG